MFLDNEGNLGTNTQHKHAHSSPTAHVFNLILSHFLTNCKLAKVTPLNLSAQKLNWLTLGISRCHPVYSKRLVDMQKFSTFEKTSLNYFM